MAPTLPMLMKCKRVLLLDRRVVSDLGSTNLLACSSLTRGEGGQGQLVETSWSLESIIFIVTEAVTTTT
jgi:hypothetical protein